MQIFKYKIKRLNISLTIFLLVLLVPFLNSCKNRTVTPTLISTTKYWSTFRHDSFHTGASRFEGTKKSNINWSYLTGNEVNSSAVQDVDGYIYIGSDDFNIYCFSRKGNLRWKYKTGSYIISSPSINKFGHIFMGSED
ncbi:MAG: PQQ-like beta-propeller repeat protein, partial [Candidatus Eremiobacteraeota bacterium]|nr:PQQ-like beta-propeller repeat protein [Candidatus Eremiobacteraeota bacterium]